MQWCTHHITHITHTHTTHITNTPRTSHTPHRSHTPHHTHHTHTTHTHTPHTTHITHTTQITHTPHTPHTTQITHTPHTSHTHHTPHTTQITDTPHTSHTHTHTTVNINNIKAIKYQNVKTINKILNQRPLLRTSSHPDGRRCLSSNECSKTDIFEQRLAPESLLLQIANQHYSRCAQSVTALLGKTPSVITLCQAWRGYTIHREYQKTRIFCDQKGGNLRENVSSVWQ
jgi:hypothetical protein